MPNIIEITDFTAPELDIYARLNENQLLHYYEPNGGIFIAESPNVILRALQVGYTPISLLLEKKHIDGQAHEVISRCGDIPVYTAPFDVLTKLTGFQLTRGLLCAMYRPALPSVEEICKSASRIAVLENVMNPTNIGAIFRSAAALSMDAVLLTSGCSDPLYRRASRVSMGTVFQIPWTYVDKKEFSTTIENYMFNFTFSIYECDLNGKNKTRLFKMENLVTSPDVVANNMVFYLEHYKENALKETSRVINSYDIINSVYGQVASGKECTISDYRPRNKSDYQGKLLDKPYIPLFKDNSYYEITNTKTNEVKIVGKEFIEKTKYIESLQKFNYETKRIDISNGHILLTYKLDAGNGMNYSYLVFEYDFEKETFEYKHLAFLDVDVLVNIIYLV